LDQREDVIVRIEGVWRIVERLETDFKLSPVNWRSVPIVPKTWIENMYIGSSPAMAVSQSRIIL
jgi:hypothetical protein